MCYFADKERAPNEVVISCFQRQHWRVCEYLCNIFVGSQ